MRVIDSVAATSAAALPETCGGSQPPVLWIRAGQAGYVGPELGVDLHTTSVAVLAVGLDGPFAFETADREPIVARSAFAPARSAHRVVAPQARILLVFVDPTGMSPARVAAAMRTFVGPFGFDHRREGELVVAAGNVPVDHDTVLQCAGVPTPTLVDPRISSLTNHMRANPGQVFRAARVAARLGLSSSHFQRLFVQQTGTTFRRYQQWARMLHVAASVVDGHDLTRSAIDAGFASLSHFSDTFHRTFGLSATALFDAGVRFDVQLPGCASR
jgi:AraC-like DNA-binding protein